MEEVRYFIYKEFHNLSNYLNFNNHRFINNKMDYRIKPTPRQTSSSYKYSAK